jgi:hypothetical protein
MIPRTFQKVKSHRQDRFFALSAPWDAGGNLSTVSLGHGAARVSTTRAASEYRHETMQNASRVILLVAFIAMNGAFADALAGDDPPASPEDMTVLIQTYLADAARLRGKDLTPEERTSLTTRVAQERAALKNARKNLRLESGAKPFGVVPAGATESKMTQCEVCGLIFKQMEMKLGKAKFPADVVASFEESCRDAMKSPIFMQQCEDMYDDIYAMTDDYLNQKSAFCERWCPKPPTP